MASMSRFVAKDCHFTTCAALHKPSSSSLSIRRLNTHLDLKGWNLAPKNGKILALQSKPNSPVVSVSAASPVMQTSRSSVVLCNAATNLSGDVPSTVLLVTWLQTDLFTVGLGFLMLSMGLTLTFEDFRRCLRNPWTVGVGFLAQYLIKPLLGFAIASLLNHWSYYHDTPSHQALAGQLVPVDAAGLALSTFQVVLVPTILGVLANEFFPKFTSKIISVTPLIGVLLTTLLCASPIGQVADVLKTQGVQLILPVAVLHAAAFAIGYFISKLSLVNPPLVLSQLSVECRALPLDSCLLRSTLQIPSWSVPSAVSVVAMALGGSALAVFWRNMPIPADDKDDFKE
ncbi:unnamed protein product [Linum tenue]|uniref:Uncharacterized protein n=1 Tax=Linum tenue TaxID=586396 RepID=A0AAV0HXV2_9ROSI|nr:unnamed protein product [Linum tenue]